MRCRFCGDEHANSSKHFPLALQSDRKIIVDGKARVVKVVVGYVCNKCLSKHRRAEFIKKHQIKPAFGQRVGDSIREQLEKMKFRKKKAIPTLKSGLSNYKIEGGKK